MSKLLGLATASALSIGSFCIYRKATEFETNVTVLEKDYGTCLFGQIPRCTVVTDKGSFYYNPSDFLAREFNNKDSYDNLNKKKTYHVTAYGVHYPKLYLYRKIVSQNGTPCDLSHCKEKPSIVSRLVNKFA